MRKSVWNHTAIAHLQLALKLQPDFAANTVRGGWMWQKQGCRFEWLCQTEQLCAGLMPAPRPLSFTNLCNGSANDGKAASTSENSNLNTTNTICQCGHSMVLICTFHYSFKSWCSLFWKQCEKEKNWNNFKWEHPHTSRKLDEKRNWIRT